MKDELQYTGREEVLKDIENAERAQDLDELRRLYKILFKLMDKDLRPHE